MIVQRASNKVELEKTMLMTSEGLVRIRHLIYTSHDFVATLNESKMYKSLFFFADRCVGARSHEQIQHRCIDRRLAKSSAQVWRRLDANRAANERGFHRRNVHERQLLQAQGALLYGGPRCAIAHNEVPTRSMSDTARRRLVLERGRCAT